MAVETVTQSGREGVTEVDLAVQVSGMTITVKAGEGKWCGRDVSLAEDKAYIVQEDPDDRAILGYLVEDESNEVSVLVDEIAQDDPPFAFAGSGYTPVMLLFRCDVAGAATSIEGAPMKVYRVVQPPELSEGGE